MVDRNKIQALRESMESQEDQPRNFEDYLNRFAAPVGELVGEYIAHASHPDLERYLYAPMRAFNENAGKRHRPLITLAACRAVGGDIARAIPAACAIEHFHNAALIHDDIADAAQLRRGKPCLYLSEGYGTAINIGDLGLVTLLCGPVLESEELDDFTKLRILGELERMATCTIEGQALDIGWARDGRYDISLEDYLYMATHKTAHYSGAVPLAVGAIAGNASEAQIEALRSFGLDTGLAFQIQDDLLNLVGETGAKKKDFRSDITEGKRTMVAVHALQHSAQAPRLEEILSSQTTDERTLQEAVDIMTEAGSLDFVRAYAHDMIDAAKERLVRAIEPSGARDLLISMADWFVDRMI